MTTLVIDLCIKPEALDDRPPEGAVEMVRQGYDEATRCLGFRVDFYMGAGVAAALRAIGTYNNFEAGRVIRALSALTRAGQLATRVHVGREYSPVLYLELTDDADPALVEGCLRGAGAQEFGVFGSQPRVVRAWWD